MPLDEPVAERERGTAVVLVVCRDGIQQRLVARAHPILVGEHGTHTAAHIGTPIVRNERLNLFQRIALDAGAKALPHDRKQINEHGPAQQFVHRVFARRVRPHQLLERRILVGAIVIHVHSGVGRETFMDQIDEDLQHPTFADAIVRPHRSILPNGAVAEQDAEQKVQTSCRLPERIAFDVEDHVAWRGPRQ